MNAMKTRLGSQAASAGVGAGGKGESDLNNFFKSGKADIAFLCDVDDRQSVKSRERFPKAKYYKDFRELLDKENWNVDMDVKKKNFKNIKHRFLYFLWRTCCLCRHEYGKYWDASSRFSS